MDLISPCRAGLDAHERTEVACLRRLGPDGTIDSQVYTDRTVTADLIAPVDGLDAEGATRVALESTGVSWRPVFHLLEGRFEVLLVNAPRIQDVPGRKTDVKDAEWIAQLPQHDL